MLKKGFVAALLLACVVALHAEQTNIRQSDPANVIHAQVITAGSSFTQARAFTALDRSVNQSVQVQGTGTSPNYKVEILITVDGTNYVKPEIGGDLGTFTDQNNHIVALGVPMSVGHKLKFTELGAVNPITVEAWERSQ